MTDLLNDPEVPEKLRQILSAGAHVEEIRLDARGRWIHRGEGFENQRIAQLFHRSVTHTSAGNWLLEVPPYTYPIVVELTGRFIARIHAPDDVELLDGQRAAPAWETARTDGVDIVVVRVDGEWARVVGSAYTTLVEHLDVDRDGTWITTVGDAAVRLPVLEDDAPLWTAIRALQPEG